MKRGTTPTHTFTVDVDLTSATVIYLTYKQNGETIVERDISNMTVTSDSIEVKLTQTETLAFSTTGNIQIQIRAGFSDGSRIASDILSVSPAGQILKEGAI